MVVRVARKASGMEQRRMIGMDSVYRDARSGMVVARCVRHDR